MDSLGIGVRILAVAYLALAPALAAPARGCRDPIPRHLRLACQDEARNRRLQWLAALRQAPRGPRAARQG